MEFNKNKPSAVAYRELSQVLWKIKIDRSIFYKVYKIYFNEFISVSTNNNRFILSDGQIYIDEVI